MRFYNQQYDMTVNRNLTTQLQVNVKDIDNTMAALYGRNKVSIFDANGKTYNVYMQAQENDLHGLSSIDKFYVNNLQNQLIPLSNLISIQPILTSRVTALQSSPLCSIVRSTCSWLRYGDPSLTISRENCLRFFQKALNTH